MIYSNITLLGFIEIKTILKIAKKNKIKMKEVACCDSSTDEPR